MCQQGTMSSSSSSSPANTTTLLSSKQQQRTAQVGDIVTMDLNLTPEHGYVPNSLFDTCGKITFVLGWGNYLPGLHTLVEGMTVGESTTSNGVSIDAGWGKRKQSLIVTVPKSKLKSLKDASVIQVGYHLHLGDGDMKVLVTDVTEDTITVDANPPLAGASYNCALTIERIESTTDDSSPYKIATFGLGCFWGAQLAFARTRGVVGTKAGYTQGIQDNPTYEQVCEGKTRHREAVTVVYDPTIVSYEELLKVALERLDQTTDVLRLNELFAGSDGESEQYRHGFYYHDEEQKRLAEELVSKNDNRYRIELLSATKFFDAEAYHQHYLLKGGQSARMDAKETIRCFG